jgi:hypothetical protein
MLLSVASGNFNRIEPNRRKRHISTYKVEVLTEVAMVRIWHQYLYLWLRYLTGLLTFLSGMTAYRKLIIAVFSVIQVMFLSLMEIWPVSCLLQDL